jgi:uncharacterized protein YbjT (DUF2867 family)
MKNQMLRPTTPTARRVRPPGENAPPQLGEFRLVSRFTHDLLLATGARAVGRRRTGRSRQGYDTLENLLEAVLGDSVSPAILSPVHGDRKFPTCATRDIAAVAARLLLEASWSGVGHAAVLGPEDLSSDDMAGIISDVLRKPVRFQQVSFEAFRSGLIECGVCQAFAQGITDMMRAKDEGLDNAEVRTPENTTPTSFRQWCEEVLRPAVFG